MSNTYIFKIPGSIVNLSNIVTVIADSESEAREIVSHYASDVDELDGEAESYFEPDGDPGEWKIVEVVIGL